MNWKTFDAELKSTLKSEDTEGPFEIYVTRLSGYLWALLFKRLGIHPNVVTIVSIVLGALAGYMFYFEDLTQVQVAKQLDMTQVQVSRWKRRFWGN